jgi:hypothetical protein
MQPTIKSKNNGCGNAPGNLVKNYKTEVYQIHGNLNASISISKQIIQKGNNTCMTVNNEVKIPL